MHIAGADAEFGGEGVLCAEYQNKKAGWVKEAASLQS